MTASGSTMYGGGAKVLNEGGVPVRNGEGRRGASCASACAIAQQVETEREAGDPVIEGAALVGRAGCRLYALEGRNLLSNLDLLGDAVRVFQDRVRDADVFGHREVLAEIESFAAIRQILEKAVLDGLLEAQLRDAFEGHFVNRTPLKTYGIIKTSGRSAAW